MMRKYFSLEGIIKGLTKSGEEEEQERKGEQEKGNQEGVYCDESSGEQD